jgi:hypothetical protein
VDFSVDIDSAEARFRALTGEGRSWLLRNYSSTRALHVSAANGRMVVRAMLAEGLVVSTMDADDESSDFADQHSLLLRLRAARCAGRRGEALTKLLALRARLVEAVDPKNGTLIPAVDREIAACTSRAFQG